MPNHPPAPWPHRSGETPVGAAALRGSGAEIRAAVKMLDLANVLTGFTAEAVAAKAAILAAARDRLDHAKRLLADGQAAGAAAE